MAILPLSMTIDIATLAYHKMKKIYRKHFNRDSTDVSRQREFEDRTPGDGDSKDSETVHDKEGHDISSSSGSLESRIESVSESSHPTPPHSDIAAPQRPITEVSILVPAYNEQSRLRFTLDSILQQTYPIKGIYVLDDLSSDTTPDICRSFAEKDPRVHHIRRGGKHGKAGNINLLTQERHNELGEYVFIVDGDVELEKDCLEQLVDASFREKGRADAVTGFGYTRKPNSFFAGSIYEGESWVNSVFSFRKRAQTIRQAVFVVCGALSMYRTETLKQLPMPERTVTEDTDFTWLLQENGYSIVYEPKARARGGSPDSIKGYWKRYDRWFSGTFQNMYVHGFRELNRSKSLLYSTIAPGLLEVIPYSVAISTLPITAYLAPDLAKGILAADFILSAPFLFMHNKGILGGLKNLPNIYAFKYFGSMVGLYSCLKTTGQRIAGMQSSWRNDWESSSQTSLKVESLERQDFLDNLDCFIGLPKGSQLGYLLPPSVSSDSYSDGTDKDSLQPPNLSALESRTIGLDASHRWKLSNFIEHDGELLGYILASRKEKSSVSIDFMDVTEGSHGNDVGKLLLDDLVERCHAKRISSIAIDTQRHEGRIVDMVKGYGGNIVRRPSADINEYSSPETPSERNGIEDYINPKNDSPEKINDQISGTKESGKEKDTSLDMIIDVRSNISDKRVSQSSHRGFLKSMRAAAIGLAAAVLIGIGYCGYDALHHQSKADQAFYASSSKSISSIHEISGSGADFSDGVTSSISHTPVRYRIGSMGSSVKIADAMRDDARVGKAAKGYSREVVDKVEQIEHEMRNRVLPGASQASEVQHSEARGSMSGDQISDGDKIPIEMKSGQGGGSGSSVPSMAGISTGSANYGSSGSSYQSAPTGPSGPSSGGPSFGIGSSEAKRFEAYRYADIDDAKRLDEKDDYSEKDKRGISKAMKEYSSRPTQDVAKSKRVTLTKPTMESVLLPSHMLCLFGEKLIYASVGGNIGAAGYHLIRKYEDSTASDSHLYHPHPKEPRPIVAAQLQSEYVVRTGDTLWKIVRDGYGLKSGQEIAGKIKDVVDRNRKEYPVLALDTVSVVNGKTVRKPDGIPGDVIYEGMKLMI